MSGNNLLFLDWDSQQLGIKVGRIMPDDLTEVALNTYLQKGKAENYQLLYCAIPSENTALIAAAKKIGLLVDHKVTYAVNLNAKTFSAIKTADRYSDQQLDNNLLSLAYESGNYSRFRQDPNITEAQFQSIYKTWIANSIKHTIADDVLVIKSNNQKIIGMVTVSTKKAIGNIGLLAVSAEARGQQIGTKLVESALHYFIDKKLSYATVITQQDNVPACRLYEKCGYHIEKVECYFHFWLNR